MEKLVGVAGGPEGVGLGGLVEAEAGQREDDPAEEDRAGPEPQAVLWADPTGHRGLGPQVGAGGAAQEVGDGTRRGAGVLDQRRHLRAVAAPVGERVEGQREAREAGAHEIAPAARSRRDAGVDDPVEHPQLLLQRGRARRGDLVGTAAVLARQRLDQAAALEARQRPVEGAGAELHPRHRLDVLGYRVAVLRPLREAGEHEQPRIRRTLTDVSHCVIVAHPADAVGIEASAEGPPPKPRRLQPSGSQASSRPRVAPGALRGRGSGRRRRRRRCSRCRTASGGCSGTSASGSGPRARW